LSSSIQHRPSPVHPMNTPSNSVKGFRRLEASTLIFVASSVVQLAAGAAAVILFPDAVRDIYWIRLDP